MDTTDFSIFCETAIEANMDISDIRSRVLIINQKLMHMRKNKKLGLADATARAAVFVIRDMTDGLKKYKSADCVTAITGGTEVMAAVLPKIDALGDIAGNFVGLAASVFQHFNIGRDQGIDKILDAVVKESREFLTDTELLSAVIELQGELSHHMVFLAAMVPGSLCEEEAPGICTNLPPWCSWKAMHLIEDRIKEYFVPHVWRTDGVNACLTYVRLYGHLMTLRLIVLCRVYDLLYRCDGLGSIAAGYMGAMKAVIGIARNVLKSFERGDCFSISSCVGPVEWPSVYILLTILGNDHSQCGDWVYNDPGPPDTALSVGKGRLGGEHYYIGRTEFRDELVVGVIYGRKMYWTSDAVEYTTTNTTEYEILCVSDTRVHAAWRANTKRDPALLGAYRAGRSPYGDVYYAGRMEYLGQVVVGKVVGGMFIFAHNGREVVVDDPEQYEVLCFASG